MIIETIELFNENELTIDELTENINNGVYDDILNDYSFLILTDKGVVKVKRDKSITYNVLIDNSNLITEINDLKQQLQELTTIVNSLTT